MQKEDEIIKAVVEIASQTTPKQFLANVKSLMKIVEEKDGG